MYVYGRDEFRSRLSASLVNHSMVSQLHPTSVRTAPTAKVQLVLDVLASFPIRGPAYCDPVHCLRSTWPGQVNHIPTSVTIIVFMLYTNAILIILRQQYCYNSYHNINRTVTFTTEDNYSDGRSR